MNISHSNKNKPCSAGSSYKSIVKSALLSVTMLAAAATPVLAQSVELTYTKPSWWFGLASGANFNFYEGSTSELNENITPPLAFHEGFGAGLYLAPTIEYYRPNTVLGMMLQVGYDNRQGKFNQIITTCNCPADLSTNISYLTVEPSLRIAPLKNNFYLFVGPRLAFNLQKSFAYQLGVNRSDPNQTPTPEVTGDLNNMNTMLLSSQVGAGIDIPLSPANKRTQFILSPFVAFHPYFGQNPRSIETWNVTSLRVGTSFKFGFAKESATVKPSEDANLDETGNTIVKFSVTAPAMIRAEQKFIETFPIRNYVFFNEGSSEIADRYVLLTKNEVKDFREDQVELNTPKNFSGRSKRQLAVYYNIMNILGDRMTKNPNATIKLVGTSETSAEDGRNMSESIKTYLVDVFSIDASRISTEGRIKANGPAQTADNEGDLKLLKQGDRRVAIESTSPEMLMEFQTGPNASLKPIQVSIVEDSYDSYLIIENREARKNFTSWVLVIRDKKGVLQNYGPYTEDKVMISGKDILGSNLEGKYNVKMIGTTENGFKIAKDTNVNLVLMQTVSTEMAMRFSVIYELNESKTIDIYEKYLTEVVVNKIPRNGKVIIHGHTDVVGESDYNEILSMQRANDVKRIMTGALARQNRSDVKFEVSGFGENQIRAPFDNKFPEERFYNRTVIIDIIPEN